MTNKKISFDEKGARRIIDTVRSNERTQRFPKGWVHSLDPQNNAQNFIAVKVLTCDITSDPPKHTWVKVELGSSGQWTERPDWEQCTSGQIAESSLIHPCGLAIEPNTICLAHWSIDQGFLLAETDHIIAYKLLEDMDAMNTTAKAKAVDGNGVEYGPEIQVVMDPFLKNQYGPALEGWYGYAQLSPSRNSSSGAIYKEWNVIHQMRFATFIEWEVTGGLETCQTEANVNAHWDGEEPKKAEVKLPSCFSCDCYRGEECGVACFCPDESTVDKQIYHIVLIDQLLNVAKLGECATDPCIDGEPIKNLRIGDGLIWETQSCSDYGCLGKLSNAGINVSPIECGSSGGIVSGTDVLALNFADPLLVEIEGTCPKVAVVKLAEDLIQGSDGECIDVNVTSSGCRYTISADLNPNCIPVYEAGTCISLEQGEETTVINNTMTIEGGAGDGCIQISVTPGEGEDVCKYTIDATFDDSCLPKAPKVIAGECIVVNESVDLTGATTYTIDNDLKIVGGNGIKVNDANCTYTISLDDPLAGPLSTLQILCDVDISLTITCVESSGGGWSLVATPTITKSFATLTVPAEFVVVGCGSSGGGGGGGDVFTCEDCPSDTCTSEETALGKVTWMKVTDGVLECDCQPSGDAQLEQEGWTECASTGGTGLVDITVTGIVCTQPNPHIEFTVNGMGEADSYGMTITGNGVTQTVGPSYDHEEKIGQDYWGIISGVGNVPTCGNTYQVTINSFDATGAVIGSETVSLTCTEDDNGPC